MSLISQPALSIFDKSFCHPQSISFSPDGRWLALGTGLGDIAVYSTTTDAPPRYHLSVDNDMFNAIAVTCVEWTNFLWLNDAAIKNSSPEVGIVAAFEDGHIRIVERCV